MFRRFVHRAFKRLAKDIQDEAEAKGEEELTTSSSTNARREDKYLAEMSDGDASAIAAHLASKAEFSEAEASAIVEHLVAEYRKRNVEEL